MAQYYEVVSQGKANSDQTHQFFDSGDNEGAQVRYILAEDATQFSTQQLVLSSDQVMVLDGSQQQLQSVVIDQGHSYQSSGQPQQFGTLVQNVDLSNQTGQQVFFMENSNGSRGETVQAVVEQSTNQGRPIVLNHHLTSNSASSNTQLFQGNNAPRMLAHVRTTLRQTPVQQLNQSPQSNHQSPLLRPAVPQQNRPAQSIPMRNMIRQQQAQMRFRTATPRPKQVAPQQNMVQVSRPNVQQMPQFKNQIGLNRPLPIAQQSVQVSSGGLLSGSPQKSASDLVQTHRMSQTRKPTVEEELDDHDPAMNSTPGQVMCDYKKILEQRQQTGKHPILARLPGNVLVPSVTKQRPQQGPVQSQLQNDEATRTPMLNQTPEVLQTQIATKKPRTPAKPRNPGIPKPPTAARQRNPKQAAAGAQQPFNSGLNRVIGPSDVPDTTSRFSVQQQHQQRFNNQHQQHQMHHQQAAPQNGITPNQNMSTSTNSSQSHMNYLITAPNANRPQQQRPLPSYVPSSQIQQIIENTPMEEEYSDSIRMLVLLESGEQRLITFTLPSEACTIQEILRQVRVPFTHETNIRVTEANSNGINYIVTVGNVPELIATNEEENPETPEPDQQVPQAASPSQNAAVAPTVPVLPPEPPKPVTPELPKLIPGRLAVCSACGYTGEDFNKCTRCARKLPENVKSVEAPKPEGDVKKSENSFSGSSQSKTVTTAANVGKLDPGSKLLPPVGKKRVTKPKPSEPESVVISSDEEEDEKKPSKLVCDQWLNKLGASISICPVTKEPSLSDIKKHVRKLATESDNPINITLKCRTVRIGSYRFVPRDDVLLDSKCIIIKAPVIGSNNSEFKTIRLDRGDIVKVLICYNKALPVIFCYVNVGAAPIIREMLKLDKESGYYFDPVDEKDDTFRKITFLPDDPIEEQKDKFQELYGGVPVSCIEELTVKEANNILIKACLNDTPSRVESFSEIKEILMYPKEGQGRLSINTEDYVCLGIDQFLNDKIIDFYLKYLWENLPTEQQEKVHVFSTFFYKRLTTKPTKAAKKSHPYESDPSLSAAEKRHYRVKNWTKRINLFEKDFIIVPINENAHWFLAIICFPGLSGPQTFDGKPYNPEPKPKKNAKSKTNSDTKKEMTIACDEPLLSDKDEADSDSDMCSNCSEESVPVTPPTQAKTKIVATRPAIKQPCILIFDSLAGPSRSRVVATLRDYLTIEYKTKMDTERVFDKDTIKGSSCKVPQQNNFTDCGLYVLQYVEQFFNDPIKDYYIPIKGITKWFEEITVTKKREDICNLLKELMTEAGTNTKILPDIVLPTLNGKIVERQEPEREPEPNEEEQEDMFTDIEDAEMTDSTGLTVPPTAAETETNKSDDSFASGDTDLDLENSPIKPSDSSVDEKSEIVTSTVLHPIKPTLSDAPRQDSNRDTLSYLKAKRIVRRKAVSDEPDLKKSKLNG